MIADQCVKPTAVGTEEVRMLSTEVRNCTKQRYSRCFQVYCSLDDSTTGKIWYDYDGAGMVSIYTLC